MNGLRETHSSSNSCSCTSCVYKSGSDQPSLQQLVLKGSKVDRLYYGKYIPLREKKLLDKLVRTRAVYDDIRAQLVTESASSVQKNADFKIKSSPSNELEKSSAILEMVNLVDKGAALKSPNLSECCSCCSCSSTTHFLNKRSRKLHQHRHAIGTHHEKVTLRQEMKKRKGVKFVPKHIKSDPCTCTIDIIGKEKFNLDSNIESSLNNDEEIQPRPRKFKGMSKSSLQNIIDSKTKIKNKISEGVQMLKNSKTLLQDSLAIRVKESFDKVRQLKHHLKKAPVEDDYYIIENRKVTILKNAGRPSYEKIRDSQIRFKNKILEGEEAMGLSAKKSIEKVKQTSNKIHSNIKASMDRLIAKKKLQKNVNKKMNSLPPDKKTDLAHKIRKDSIVKFKEDLKRRKLLEDWACEGCIENVCNPEECFEKLKLKRAKKLKRRYSRDKGVTNILKRKQREEITTTSSKSSNIRVQTRPVVKISKTNQNMSWTDTTKKPKTKINIRKNIMIVKKQKRSNFQFDKSNGLVTNQLGIISMTDKKSNTRQPVRVRSSLTMSVDKPLLNVPNNSLDLARNTSKSSGITLSRQKTRQRKKTKNSVLGSQLTSKSGKYHKIKKGKLKLTEAQEPVVQPSESLQCQCITSSILNRKTNQYNLLPLNCKQGVCTPGACDPGNCLKLINKRKASSSKQSYTSSRKTKSTSSVASKIKSLRAKQVQSVIIPRRKQIMEKEKLKLHSRKVIGKANPHQYRNVVSIGSTFSFNIEFSKNTKIPHEQEEENLTGIHSFSIKPKITEKKYKHYLNKNSYKEKKRKTSIASTEKIHNSNSIKTRDRSTITKNESGICFRGDCDPHECLQRRMKRNNTRDVSLSTVSPENKSTYSTTKNKYKSAFIQSTPSTRERKTLVKSNIYNTNMRTPHITNVGFDNNSKQSVNIGSSFSFNIEFSKNYTAKDTKQDIKPSEKTINISTRKRVKEKGIDIEKVGNGDMHTIHDLPIKSQHSSLVDPTLKRCFCTLNLYKKQKGDFNKLKKKHPLSTAYTVNTAFIQNNKRLLLKTKHYDDFLSKQSTMHLIPIYTALKTKQSLAITSDLSLNVELVKQSSKKYNKYLKQSCSVIEKNSIFEKRNDLTGLSKYFKRCFHIMNMQYENKLRKLEPYECEPGICVPGQCDPYECQKRIMKRLQKGYSKLSGTDSQSISISGSQTPKTNTHSHFTNVAIKPQHKKKKSKQTIKSKKVPHGLKQAVRVGSSFSFDVEFYKGYKNTGKNTPIYTDRNATHSIPKSRGTVKPQQREKYKGKNMYTKPNIKDSIIQFHQTTKNQGSHALEDMNRCFCTLKLHKKGKHIKTYSTSQNQTTLPYEPIITTVHKGQNTRGYKEVQDLLPYECEPGTCIPGECNPYECLSRINKRNLHEKAIGTVTTTAAAGANTVGAKSKYKTRSVGMKNMASSSNTFRNKNKLRTRAVKVKDIKSKVKSLRRINTHKSNKTAYDTKRQAVRISSNFGVDINFFKGANTFESEKKIKQDKPKSKQKGSGQKISKQKGEKSKKITTDFPTSHTSVSQTLISPRKNMATMVKPFLQRCFCTLQLRNQKQIKEKSNQLKEKHFKSTMTMTDTTDHKGILAPYECEPGVCVPYKCNPYDCQKLINKRLNIHTNKLLPYECEPNFCTPNECNPPICLERRKKRNDFNKTSGAQYNRPVTKNLPAYKTTANQPMAFETVTNYTQVTKPASSAVNTFFKKCFCTLKFNTKHEKNPSQTKLAKLKPYECEPYTCVPGECDPYQCEKRIRKRLLRENTTGPINKKHTSQSTLTPMMKVNKYQNIDSKRNNTKSKKLNMNEVKSRSSNVHKDNKPIRVIASNNEKQSVRIGSTFSFDVEFYKKKSSGSKSTKSIVKRKGQGEKNIAAVQKYKGKSKGLQSRNNIGKYDASQLTHPQTKSSSTFTDPLLKRCFCTLQLHQNSTPKFNFVNTISTQPTSPTAKNKVTHTNNADVSTYASSPYECPPFFCIPDQCNPYECAKHLRRLNIRNQSVAIGTQPRLRNHHQSVEVRPHRRKNQKTQSDILKKSKPEDDQNIVEIPRFTNYLNKENLHGVRIGSNVSVNIEFFKEYTSPVPTSKSKKEIRFQKKGKKSNKDEKSSSYPERIKQFADKDISSFQSKIRNAESQVKNKMDNKSSNTINKLKRCFCTLKLQKDIPNTHVPYPQQFEVRRAEVKITKVKGTTRNSGKPLNEKFKDQILLQPLEIHSKNNQMQTILSYKPKKFNKEHSKTLIMDTNLKNKPSKKRMSWLSKKQLTRKQSAHPINIETRSYNCDKSSCFCNAVGTLEQVTEESNYNTTKKKQIFPTNFPKSSVSDRRPKKSIPSPNVKERVKTSKSANVTMKNLGKKSKHLKSKNNNLAGNKFKDGDVWEAGDVKKSDDIKKSGNIKNAGDVKNVGNVKKVDDSKKADNSKKADDSKKAGGTDIGDIKDNNYVQSTKKQRGKKKPIEVSKAEIVKNEAALCPYCGQNCVKGGVGAFLLNSLISCVQKMNVSTEALKIDRLKRKVAVRVKKQKKSKELKPLFDVLLEADSFNIINKEEVSEKVTRLQTKSGKSEKNVQRKKHDKFCTCCICLGNKGNKSKMRPTQARQGSQDTKESKKYEDKAPCVCGSKICKKDVNNARKVGKSHGRKHVPPCFCGSPLCAEETEYLKGFNEDLRADICICNKIAEEKSVRERKQFERIRKIRSDIHRQEDKARRKRRKKNDKILEKSIKGNKNDVLLVTESLMDVAKLGFTGVGDILRIAYRCARNPKHTWFSMKSMAKDPSLIGKTLKDTYYDTGLAATGRRIGMRVSKMNSVAKTKRLLEKYAVTNYILHMTDKDPRKRLRPRQEIPQKDQLNLGCNLYASSLRKRPFLWIFNRWPSFYPHCLALLNVWKQFAEIMAFLLAVVFWSPCILAVEVCRAVMCCTLCTG